MSYKMNRLNDTNKLKESCEIILSKNNPAKDYFDAQGYLELWLHQQKTDPTPLLNYIDDRDKLLQLLRDIHNDLKQRAKLKGVDYVELSNSIYMRLCDILPIEKS
jgi:hypothetical protein